MTIFILALTSAFFVGLSNVLSRKGLDSTTRTQAILVSLISSTLALWMATLAFADIRSMLVPAAFLFVVVGVFGPGLGRTLNITSLKRIGVSRTIPITGTAPFFATIVAILLLGESYSLYIFLGTVLIVLGIYILSRRSKSSGKKFDKKDLLLPLGAAALGGFSIAMSKKALVGLEEPIGGAALAVTAALFVVVVYTILTGRIQRLQLRRDAIAFPAFAGVAMASAFLLNFSALKIGDVSIVAPVFSTFPLFGVFLSHFILKEQITARMYLGAIIIILGVAVIQVF